MERTAITKKDLDLARALLTRAREELHPDQWADLDRKLTDADGTLPAWSAAELALATRLGVLASTAKRVEEDLETKRRRYPYVVRLQAQGDSVEKSVVLAGPGPITIAEGLAGLEALRGKLTKKELQVRDKFFRQAERFIRNAHGYGVGPPGKSFGDQDSDTPSARVDVEILFGVNFQR